MIRLAGLAKAFGATPVLRGIDLFIDSHRFVALLGPSGSGKSTLLRLLAGLEQPDAGGIEIDGQSALHLPPGERRIGFVFQNYALFGHMTVFENIAFGLRVKPRRLRGNAAAIRASVERLLRVTRLEGLGPRMPAQLSGGQRQRVALARALAIEPRILLLDEPFGAQDQHVRAEQGAELRRLHDAFGMTTLFVTHDQQEAWALADRVVSLRDGRIETDTGFERLVRHPRAVPEPEPSMP
jgi:sulfate transport system ATP-binding protein